MGFRRRTKRGPLIAGAAMAHRECKKAGEQQPAGGQAPGHMRYRTAPRATWPLTTGARAAPVGPPYTTIRSPADAVRHARRQLVLPPAECDAQGWHCQRPDYPNRGMPSGIRWRQARA